MVHRVVTAKHQVGQLSHDVAGVDVGITLDEHLLDGKAPKVINRHFGLRLHVEQIIQDVALIHLETPFFPSQILEGETGHAVAQQLDAAVNSGDSQRLVGTGLVQGSAGHIDTQALARPGAFLLCLLRGLVTLCRLAHWIIVTMPYFSPPLCHVYKITPYKTGRKIGQGTLGRNVVHRGAN